MSLCAIPVDSPISSFSILLKGKYSAHEDSTPIIPELTQFEIRWNAMNEHNDDLEMCLARI